MAVSTIAVVGSILWTLFFINSIVNLVLLLRRRQLQPLKSRSVVLLSLLMPTSLFVVTAIIYQLVVPCPCGLYSFVFIVAWPAYWTYFWLRAYRIFSIYRINTLKTNWDQTGTLGSGKTLDLDIKVLNALKRRTSDRFLVTVGGFMLALYLLSWVVYSVIMRDEFSNLVCTHPDRLFYYLILHIVCAMITQLVLMWMMRKESDDFNLFKEIGVMSVLWLVVVLTVMLFLAIDLPLYQEIGKPITNGLQAILVWCEIILGFTVPGFMTFSSSQRAKFVVSDMENGQVRDLQDELLSALKDKDVIVMFKAFCKKQFCLENVLFFEEIQAFKEAPTMPSAQSISTKYLELKSPLALNTNSDTKKAIRDKLTNSNLSDEAFISLFRDLELEV